MESNGATIVLGRLALGLNKHPFHGYDGLLGRFAAHVDALTYWDIFDDTDDMRLLAERLLILIENADEVYFNLDGLLETGATLDEVAQYGSEGIGPGNVTNWEFYRIVNNPKYLAKTTFFRNGEQFYGIKPR